MASSYAEARTKVAPRRKGPQCSMCALLERLEPADKAAVEADMDNPLVQNTMIRRALVASGHPIGQHVLDRHVRGDCQTR
jgi:hypothetical protein